MQSGLQLPPLRELVRELIPQDVYYGYNFQSAENTDRHQAARTTSTYKSIFQLETAPSVQIPDGPFSRNHRPLSRPTEGDTVSLYSVPDTPGTSSESALSRVSSKIDSARSSLDMTRSTSRDEHSVASSRGSRGVARHDRLNTGRPHEQNQNKNENEKRKREDLSAQLQTLEHTLELGCRILSGEKQQPANRTSSGLTINKKDTLKHTIAILSYLVTKNIEKAIFAGDIEHHFAEMLEVIKKCDESDYPARDTIMDDGNALLCVAEKDEGQRKKLRKCVTHDHSDWVACGQVRAEAATKRNIDRLKAIGGSTNSRIARSHNTRE